MEKCNVCERQAVWHDAKLHFCEKHKPIDVIAEAKMNHLNVVIPIDDWRDEALATEIPITDKDMIVDLIETGMHTGQIARFAIVWRELGNADEDILRPNKTLLYAGAQQNISSIARRERHDVETTDGKTYRARTFVGTNGENENGKSYVHHTSNTALNWANSYMENTVPRHIWPRLVTIYENGGDVKAAALALKRTIDEQVKKLV